MSRTRAAAAKLSAVRAPSPAAEGRMATARVIEISPKGVRVELSRGHAVLAMVDPSVHPAVLETAAKRGERVLVEIYDGDQALVVGALRTQPTPGIEAAETYSISADTISLDAKRVAVEGDEVLLSSKTARIVLRATSEIESFAERIVSRAEGVHKIVGRMLRLN